MDGLADVIRDATPIDDLQVEPRLNVNPTSPSIDVYPGDPLDDPDSQAFGQIGGALIFTVRARVSTADSYAGQDLLLSLMDAESAMSISAALQDDQTLNGLATSVKVEGPSGYEQFVDPGSTSKGHLGGTALLGCTWRVTVLRAFS